MANDQNTCSCGLNHGDQPCKWEQINALAARCGPIKRPTVRVTKEVIVDLLKELGVAEAPKAKAVKGIS